MSNLPTRSCLALALTVAAACGDVPTALPDRAAPLRAAHGGASHLAAPQPMAVLYGPQRFIRTRGSSDRFTVEVSTLRFEPPFTIHVTNGAADGSARVAGAEVSLDGNVLLSQRDFGRQSAWSLPVSLGASATMQVSLSGAPGGYLEIWIEGKRSIPVFCPNGHAGSYEMLREAIEAVWVDGTVLVCDGVHSVDRVLIDKPLTLRSQNQGGATLADTQPEALYTSRLPALVIDGVSAGLVRIADISFLVKNRGITAEGTFDQVELDSVRMRGARIMNSVGLAVGSSTVPTAKVEVLRSHFEAHALGVWPIRAVETNVRWSSFHGMGGGSVVYSGGFVSGAGSGSFGVTEHNLFTDCSPVGCIRMVGPGEAGREIRIAHNVMTRSTDVRQSYAVLAARSSPGAGVEPGLVTIEHNEVLGSPPVGDPADTASWRVGSFLLVAGGPRAAPVLLRHNRVTDVHTGIQVLQNTRVTARDNSFSGGYRAVYQRDPSVFVSFQRNDVVGFGSSLLRDNSAGESGNYRCNWWGSIAGPQNPSPNVLPASYTPWSMQPIANTQTVCDPNAPPAETFAYVTSYANGAWKLNKIATSTHTVVHTLTNPLFGAGLAITPTGAHVYVSGNPTQVVATATNAVVASIDGVGSNAWQSAASPNGAFVYVANHATPGSVSVISTATNTVVATVPVGNHPFGVAVTPHSGFVYVMNTQTSNVSVISTATNTVVATIPVAAQPTSVAISPDGTLAYVGHGTPSNLVTVISTATNTVVNAIAVGSNNAAIAITPDGSFVYVANERLSTVSVIATATNTVVASIPVGSNPIGVAITPDGSFAYVTNYNSTFVSVIATATNRVVTSIPVGGQGGWVAIHR